MAELTNFICRYVCVLLMISCVALQFFKGLYDKLYKEVKSTCEQKQVKDDKDKEPSFNRSFFNISFLTKVIQQTVIPCGEHKPLRSLHRSGCFFCPGFAH